MSGHTLYLGIRAESQAIADQQVADLQAFLTDKVDDIKLERARDKPYTQDLGAILVVVLSAPAIVELAKGIADWMRKRNVMVTLSPDGKAHVEGPPEQVHRILLDILRQPPPQ